MLSAVIERSPSEEQLIALSHQWNEVLYEVTGGQARARVALNSSGAAHELVVMFRSQGALDYLQSERTCRIDLLETLRSVPVKYVVEKFTFEG